MKNIFKLFFFSQFKHGLSSQLEEVGSETSDKKLIPTSRLIVKNLPRNITEKTLRKHFESYGGAITDCRIMKTSEGKNRCFGFIGYSSIDEASKSRKYYNNTFLGTTRIIVEFSQNQAQNNIPRPWSKYAPGASNYKGDQNLKKRSVKEISESIDDNEKKQKEKIMEIKKQKKLNDFLSLTAEKAPFWANDQILPGELEISQTLKASKTEINESSDDEYEDFGSNMKNIKDDSDKDVEKKETKSSNLEENSKSGIKNETKENDRDTDNTNNGDNDLAVNCSDIGESKKMDSKDQEISLISRTGRLFIKNLYYHTTVEEIEELFGKFGPLSDVHISLDKITKESRGYGFVSYIFPSHAIKAYNKLNQSIHRGRILRISPAEESPTQKDGSMGGIGQFQTDYQKKLLEKKRSIANQDFNWNSLFVRSDAVASAMASSLKIEKSEILDKEASGSMAVRLALAETSIIQENISFLEQQGVCLENFQGHYNKNIQRSNTTILIKNLPSNTTLEELRLVFQRHGEIVRLVMPPAKTMALLEYGLNNDAKAAFKALAYKKFKDVPLFLEWAPIGVFKPDSAKKSDEPDIIKNENIEKIDDKIENIDHTENGDVSDLILSRLDSDIQEASRTLFVKNLSFNTTKTDLLNYLNTVVSGVTHVSIAMHKVGNSMLSHGFGFIEFSDREYALKAWKILRGVSLDGHQLQFNFSTSQENKQLESLKQVHRASSKRKVLESPQKVSKRIMIKNVPFEATKKEIRELFAPFGELKSVRLPNKSGGNGHRGFAFVEYLSESDAKNAILQLSSTHLYGRHLVINYAKEDEGIDYIMEKTAIKFNK